MPKKSMFFLLFILWSICLRTNPLQCDVIWDLYSKGEKELENKNYTGAFEYYKEAYEKVQKVDDKLNYSRVFTKYLTTQYLLKPPVYKDAGTHTTLYIIVKGAEIVSVEDRVNDKTYKLKTPYKNVITDDEIEVFRKNARDFDLVLTALAAGKIVYSHDIVITGSVQKDLIMSHIYRGWFGKDIYIYTTNTETITPSISYLFAENYRKYDTFSIIVPALFEGEGNPGLGKKATESNIMEGGVVPTALPIIPYVLYGEKKGFFINSVDTASDAQLLHEYVHMIENLIDTGYPAHAWLPGKKGPPGITAEMEYYIYLYEHTVSKHLDTLLHPAPAGFTISMDGPLYKKALTYSKKYKQEDLGKAYLLYKTGDRKAMEKALDLIPDYPFAGVLLGGWLRYEGNNLEAYRLLKMNEELDPLNNLRPLYLAWLFSYNVSLAEYSLPYYDRAETLYKNWDQGTSIYFYEGRAKGYLAYRNYDTLITLCEKPEYSALIQGNTEKEQERELLLGKGYFYRQEYQYALKHLKKAGSSKEAGEYINAINNYYLDKKVTVTGDMNRALNEGKPPGGYWDFINKGKEAEQDREKLKYFFNAVSLSPEEWLPWYYIAEVYKKAGIWANSLYAWEEMMTRSKEQNVQEYYHLNLGLIYWDLKNLEKQGEHFAAYTSMKNEAEEIGSFYYNELINYYDRIKKDKKKALHYANLLLANEKDTEDWYYSRALIWCYENGLR